MVGIIAWDDPPSQDECTGRKSFRFLDLPPELRNEIYAHLFLQPEPIDCFRKWFTTAPRQLRRLANEKAPDCCGKNYGCAHYDARLRPRTNILRACRQISEEALDVLYSRNAFRVDLESTSRFLKFFTVGEANLRRIRRLTLCAKTAYSQYRVARPGETQPQLFRPVAAGEAPLWTALLHGLRTLLFLMKIPTWGWHGAWPVWVGQLEGVLSFVGEMVDEETDVTIDDNYSMYLCEAVDRCFKKGFRRVRTKEGNGHYWKMRFDPDNITEPLTS